jgi:hypothetical protein
MRRPKTPGAERGKLSEPSTVGKDPATGPAPITQSPTLSVVSAGSGALFPFSAVTSNRRLLGIVVPPHADCGMLLASDVPVPSEASVQLALDNIARALLLATQASASTRERVIAEGETPSIPSTDETTSRSIFFCGFPWTPQFPPGAIDHGADVFLLQFVSLLAIATRALNETPASTSAANDRVRARELIQDLTDWTTSARMSRSGNDARVPLPVNQSVADAAFELARIGRRLPLYKAERMPRDGRAKEIPGQRKLTVQQRQILRYLRKAGATDCEKRISSERIANAAFRSSSKRIKDNLAKLARLGLVDAAKGSGGGYWITPAGLKALVELGDLPDSNVAPGTISSHKS